MLSSQQFRPGNLHLQEYEEIRKHRLSPQHFPFILKRKQFPVKPAFDFTVNKSQGQTLQRMELYLHQDVFLSCLFDIE